MNARETAERHGQFVAQGNMQGAMADFTPDALQAFGALGIRPPRGTNSAAVVTEQAEGDNSTIEITYSNGTESTTIRSTWAPQGDEWKIIKAVAGE